MFISAFDVTTEASGFSPCLWPATSLQAAHNLARGLSLKLSGDARYPNAFWVSDGKGSIGKYFRGKFYAPGITV